MKRILEFPLVTDLPVTGNPDVFPDRAPAYFAVSPEISHLLIFDFPITGNPDAGV